jgi:hypothetical protein
MSGSTETGASPSFFGEIIRPGGFVGGAYWQVNSTFLFLFGGYGWTGGSGYGIIYWAYSLFADLNQDC